MKRVSTMEMRPARAGQQASQAPQAPQAGQPRVTVSAYHHQQAQAAPVQVLPTPQEPVADLTFGVSDEEPEDGPVDSSCLETLKEEIAQEEFTEAMLDLELDQELQRLNGC